ncbi:MAG: hypothetical protein UY10_C0042G0004 [Microgenomates group bacterium GW2011_GWA2_47_8]|nr:MAG: hypothetical protein UY10_C0042G0004 [Microgenomates group bacterium GW2011_GWA2_47_8]
MLVVLWSGAFAKTILPPHYLDQGITYMAMIIGTLIVFGAQFLFLISIRKGKAKILWTISFFSSLLSLVLVINIHTVWQFYLSSFMSGISLCSYWVAYNTAYFTHTPKEKTGLGSAIMFSVFPLLSIIAPPVAGYMFEANPLTFWVSSLFFYLLFYLFISRQQDFSIHYSLRTVFDEIKATRVLLFLEGIWEAMIFVIIPIYSLFFITTPLAYGAFSAYLAFVGILANLSLGKLTDKLQKRVLFLYPLTIIMAVVTFLFPMGLSTLMLWLVVTGILNFFTPLYWNITTAMFIDTHPNLQKSIPGREIILALGRIVGVSLVLFFFIIESQPRIIFYILGGIMLGYPLHLFWVSRYKKWYVFR